MRNHARHIVIIVVAVVAVTAILNIEVTTLQGVNYKVREIRIPLYLKILDFFDRHYNYRMLVKQITRGAVTDEDKVYKLLQWAHENIKKAPEGLPIVDDHVWYIIVRGYGAHDQSADVFTTLCNYAGIEAFFSEIRAKDRPGKVSLSFVNVYGKWRVFDPYYGVYFLAGGGGFASLADIRSGNWTMTAAETPRVDYKAFLENLPDVKRAGLRRATIQSPLNRLLFEVKKTWLGKKYAVEIDY